MNKVNIFDKYHPTAYVFGVVSDSRVFNAIYFPKTRTTREYENCKNDHVSLLIFLRAQDFV